MVNLFLDTISKSNGLMSAFNQSDTWDVDSLISK